MAQEMKLNEVKLTNDISSNLNAICEDGGEWTRLNLKEVLVSRNEMQELSSKMNQFSNPNLLINGDFQVWKRGESFEYSSTDRLHYLADRWAMWCSATGTITCSCVSEGLKFSVTDDSNYLIQILERKLTVGEEYTLSAMIDGEIHTMTFVAGEYKTEGRLDYSSWESGTLDRIGIVPSGETVVSWVKLEKGPIATPLIPRLYAEEAMMCQRYYYEYKDADNVGYCGASGNIYINLPQLKNVRNVKTLTYKSDKFNIVTEGSPHAFTISSMDFVEDCEIRIVSDNTFKQRPVGVELSNVRPIKIDAEIY